MDSLADGCFKGATLASTGAPIPVAHGGAYNRAGAAITHEHWTCPQLRALCSLCCETVPCVLTVWESAVGGEDTVVVTIGKLEYADAVMLR